MKKFLALFVVASLFGVATAFGQSESISGRVVDSETGEAIVGASIQVVGTQEGNITDGNGDFTISLPAGANTLKISYLGYVAREVPASNGVTVKLVSNYSVLAGAEIEVAYNTKKGQGYAGGAQTMTAEKIENRSPSEISKALSGEFAGVQVVTTSGQPGVQATIRLRGTNSVNASSAPLYVVDGVPYDGDISAIDPSDMASTTILKDATATSLYGSRGANGVILITTKNGTAGSEGKIDVDLKYGLNMRLIPQYETVDLKQYLELGWLGLYNYASVTRTITPGVYDKTSADFASRTIFASRGGIHPYYNPFVEKPADLFDATSGQLNNGLTFRHKPENWADYIFRTGKKTEATVKISGGSDRTTYFTSIGFVGDEGYYLKSDFKRFNVRSNIDVQPKKWLTGKLNIAYAFMEMNSPGQGSEANNGFFFVNGMPPIYPVFEHEDTEEGTIRIDPLTGKRAYDYGMGTNRARGFAANLNPAGAIQLDKQIYNAHNVTIQNRWEIEIIKDLKLSNTVGFTYLGVKNASLTNRFYGDAEGIGRLAQEWSNILSLTGTQMLRYKKTFNDIHNTDFFVAHEAYIAQSDMIGGQKSYIFDPSDISMSNATDISRLYGTKGVPQALDSYFGQIRYNYNEKYFAEANIRGDGSSKFAKGHRWGIFGSVGAAWIITKEGFMKDTKSWLTSLKLRANAGVTGNQEIGSMRFTDLYTFAPIDNKPALLWNTKGTANITWERSKNLDAGLEFDIKRGRLRGEVVVFNKLTDNLLFPQNVAPSLGYAQRYVNEGSIRTRGVEVELSSEVIKARNVLLRVRLNGAHYKNMVVSLPKELRNEKMREMVMNGTLAPGHAMDEWYMIHYEGVDEATGNALYRRYTDENVPGAQPTTNVYLYENTEKKDGSKRNAKWVIDKTAESMEAGRNFTGKRATPDFFGGFGIDLEAYGFELNMMFSYQIGGYGYDAVYASMMRDSQVGSNTWHKDMLNSWNSLTGAVNTNVPKLSNGMGEYASRTASASDRFLTSNSMLSLSNVRLSYSLPRKAVQKIMLNNLSIWVSGENLFSITARKGYYPTASLSGGSGTHGYLPLSTIMGGIKFQF